MGLLIVLIGFLFIYSAMRAAKDKKEFTPQIVASKCPPHKWRYVEVKDDEGKTHHWTIVCDLCGPLKPLE